MTITNIKGNNSYNSMKKHLSFCYDHTLINNVDWTQYRLYKWIDLNIKANRIKQYGRIE